MPQHGQIVTEEYSTADGRFFSAYWTPDPLVTPEQRVASVKGLYAALKDKLPQQTEAYYIFWADPEEHNHKFDKWVNHSHHIEVGPVPLEEILERHLTPSSVTTMFRTYADVCVWMTAVHSQVTNTPPLAGIISRLSLPAEAVKGFYHATSGNDPAAPIGGFDNLVNIMRQYPERAG